MFFGSRRDYLAYRPVLNGIPSWSKQESISFDRSPLYWKQRNREATSDSNDALTVKIGYDESCKTKKLEETNRIVSTKYTIFTFLPLNLFQQFRRIANFYFLMMTIIASTIDSPVSPVTCLLPLVFVISTTAAKQGYEDYVRYKTDNVVNSSPVTVIRNGQEKIIASQQIVQGDLVQVPRDCDVPCDLVILNSSDSHGRCFVTTANLDGETNLKTLSVPKQLPIVRLELMHTLGFIKCEKSTADLYAFNGRIILNQNVRRDGSVPNLESSEYHIIPLDAENLLLRGSRLKNTEWVVGCAVYTGQSTKLALNSRLTSNKVASSERHVNKFLVFILVFLICTVTFSYLYKRYFELFVVKQHWYLEEVIQDFTVGAFFQDYLSFLMLFNYLIPISLYVTIEIHKFIGAMYMEWDKYLFDEATNQPCIVNTSDLNDELGQVNILFSDKTGTLTKNEMCLQQVSIGGKKFVVKDSKLWDPEGEIEIRLNNFTEEQMVFFQALSICHTVQVAKPDDEEADSEKVQNVYEFYDIKEEGRHSSTANEIETDEADFVQVRKINSSNADNNPLLKTVPIAKSQERISEPRILRRSPRIPRDNRVHPSSDLQPRNTERNMTYQSGPVAFHRSTSHVDIPQTASAPSHRRTQSYGAPGSFQRRSRISMDSMRSIADSLSSKQGYAMPTYTKESLITRTESLRRKEVIKNYVQKLDYQASSPDEKALVEACANLGIIYLGDEGETLSIQIIPPHLGAVNDSINIPLGKKIMFKRLEVLEFTSDRKRMSVILKDRSNDIWIYMKGAESYVFPLCQNSDSEIIATTNAHVNEFARNGLRTLAFARRKLSLEEYRQFRNTLEVARSKIHSRAAQIEQVYSSVERDLTLIGATAVEDALQDNVRDTLEALQIAGIKIWVLTGDKVETAYNIALACGHISQNSAKYFITECRSPTDIKQHLTTINEELMIHRSTPISLLIDGKSLAIALASCQTEFRDVAVVCRAVLCCRLSPLQKCEVVQLIKRADNGYITAAIGDGANDVSMIQEAHVGLGIVGKEGRQAARCADYAFANFSMLKRLLLVHGHYFTRRLSLLVLYFFYKNVLFMTIQFMFQFDSMFSSISVYEALFLTLFNLLYTAVPIVVLSLSEKPYPEITLMTKPELYKNNINSHPLRWSCFLGTVCLAVYHATVIYFLTYALWNSNNAVFTQGQVGDFTAFGTMMVHNVIMVASFKLWMEAIHQTYFFIASIWISILSFVISTIVYNVITFYSTEMYWSYMNLLSSISFWLMSILVVVTSLVPDYTIKVMRDALNLPKFSIYPGTRAKYLLKRQIDPTYVNGNIESTNL